MSKAASWTDERIDTLKTMWAKGDTASQIAEALGGVSRNAVIGKAHRLGLKSRPSPVKPNEKSKAKEKPVAKAAVVDVDTKPEPAPPPPRAAQASASAQEGNVHAGGPSQPVPNPKHNSPKIVSVGRAASCARGRAISSRRSRPRPRADWCRRSRARRSPTRPACST